MNSVATDVARLSAAMLLNNLDKPILSSTGMYLKYLSHLSFEKWREIG